MPNTRTTAPFRLDEPPLPPHRPGTGPDWASAEGPGRPFPPKTTAMRPWDDISKEDEITDREHLAHLLDVASTATGAHHLATVGEIARLKTRARNGHHDGSLPELGHFDPVFFDCSNQPGR